MVRARELIRFNVLRNALYHTSRRRYFERLNRLFLFTTIVLGTAAASDVLTPHIGREWPGLAVAIVGALQLVFDFGRAARDHQALQRDYYALLAEIESTLDDDEATRARWEGQMIRITGDEPPTLRAIDAKAYNDAIDATGIFDAGERVIIPSHHKLLGLIWAFDGYNYRKLSES